MVKAVVFDLDNTLIPWLDEFDMITKRCLEENGLPSDKETFNNFQKAMQEYESSHIRFDKKEMSEFFAVKMNLDIPKDFVEKWTLSLYAAVPKKVDEQLVDLLVYLQKKYDLYVITNWFSKQQKIRLENYGILKYFTNVYGCDDYDRKPYPEMMNLILKEYDVKEIVYVGDSYQTDIELAMNLDIYAYYITTKDKRESNKYKIIPNIYELKKYL